MNKHRSAGNDWAGRVWSLLQGGNSAAAISQIKAAASLKDVQQLRKRLDTEAAQFKGAGFKGAGATAVGQVSQVVNDQINALSHPRLHRSP